MAPALTQAQRNEFNRQMEEMGKRWAAELVLQMEKTMEPMKTLVTQHEQDLNDETNGIKKTVKDLSRWRWIATGILLALSSAIFWQIVVTVSTHTK